jgi:hypothetical protein
VPGSNGSSRADVFGCVALFETGESLDLDFALSHTEYGVQSTMTEVGCHCVVAWSVWKVDIRSDSNKAANYY